MHQPSSTSEDTSERPPETTANAEFLFAAEGSVKTGVPPAPVPHQQVTVPSTSKTALEEEPTRVGTPPGSLHADSAGGRAAVESNFTTDWKTTEEPVTSLESVAGGRGPSAVIAADQKAEKPDYQVKDCEVFAHGSPSALLHPETLPEEDAGVTASTSVKSTAEQTAGPGNPLAEISDRGLSVQQSPASPNRQEVEAGASPATTASRVERDIRGTSDDEYQKTSVGDLCCMLVILPAAAFTIVYILSLVKGRSRADSAAEVTPLVELSQVCPGTPHARHFSDCHEVMTSVLEASNPNVAPCVDFYEHVCGWWNRWKDNRPSQIEELVRNFNNHVIAALLAVARVAEAAPEGPSTLPQQMAVFYLSCFDTALSSGRGGGSVVDVLGALGTDLATWLAVASFDSLLELVVSTSLKTGLPSFIAVSFKDKTYVIQAGETVASSFAQYHGVDKYAADFVLSFQTAWGPGKNASAAILELDYEVEKIRREPGQRPWITYSNTNQMDGLLPGLNWTRALEQGLPEWLRNESESYKARVRGAGHMVRLVDRLRPEPLKSSGLYSLVVLLSQIMKYKAPMKQSSSTFSATDKFHWCLEQTATNFDAIYPQWVRHQFQDQGDAIKLRAIFDDIVSTVTRNSRVNVGVIISTYRLARAQLVILGDGSHGNMSTAMLPVSVRTTFLPNVVRLIASRVGRVNDTVQQASLLQFRSHLGFHGADFVVGTAFVHRTSLYSPFARQDTRYATLTVRILRSLFESEAEYDPSWAASYVNQCFAAAVASTIGRLPLVEQDGDHSNYSSDAAVKPFMGSRWAVQLAWHMDPLRESSENRSFARLFFRIACFASCGDKRGRYEWNDFANFAPEFAEAYRCSGKRRGLCDSCSAMNRCETYLPQSD